MNYPAIEYPAILNRGYVASSECSFFEGNINPVEISEKLSLYYNVPVRPGETLLFFDEVQMCVPAITSLRFFYEKYGDLHLIAAGPLLEFALSDLPSFAVGRVRSLFMYPFSFDEYLWALGEDRLAAAKNNADYEHPLVEPLHKSAGERGCGVVDNGLSADSGLSNSRKWHSVGSWR